MTHTENKTYNKDFYFVPFSVNPNYTELIISIFFLLYIIGVFINSLIITVIYIDDQLHTPMYLFLCNLALVDICYTSTTVPNLLYMLLSGDKSVSLVQCLTQLYFYIMVGSTENVLILVMAYDRYVAICHPLHYYSILNKKKRTLITTAIWLFGGLNAIIFIISASNMSFCHSHVIHQFFCEAKALINIACAGTENFYIVVYVEFLATGFFPAVFSLTSYIKIIRVILQIKSKEGRKKIFSTCSSHFAVLIIYYMTSLSVYAMPPSEYANVLEPVFAALYTVVTPTINPIIYSLRNKDVKESLLRLLGVKRMNLY